MTTPYPGVVATVTGERRLHMQRVEGHDVPLRATFAAVDDVRLRLRDGEQDRPHAFAAPPTDLVVLVDRMLDERADRDAVAVDVQRVGVSVADVMPLGHESRR
jgi:hypothetical protein